MASLVKNLPSNAGDMRDAGSIPGSRRSLGVENVNSLQYSCLEKSVDTGAWQTIIHGTKKSCTQLKTHILMAYAGVYLRKFGESSMVI